MNLFERRSLLTRDNIDRVIPRHLKENGVDPVPDIKWSSPLVGTVQKMKARHNWSISLYKEVVSSVIEDILLGDNLDTDRDPWVQGTLSKQIKEWQSEGKDDHDIQYLLGCYVYDKARQKAKKLTKSPGDDYPPQNLKCGERENGRKEDENGIYEGNLRVEGPSNELKRKWMSGSPEDGNRALKRVLKRIDQEIKNNYGLDVQLVWQAYKNEATAGEKKNDPQGRFSHTDIMDSEIVYQDPEDGEIKEERLEDALENIGASITHWYLTEKLQDALEEINPQIEKWKTETNVKL